MESKQFLMNPDALKGDASKQSLAHDNSGYLRGSKLGMSDVLVQDGSAQRVAEHVHTQED